MLDNIRPTDDRPPTDRPALGRLAAREDVTSEHSRVRTCAHVDVPNSFRHLEMHLPRAQLGRKGDF